MRQLALLALFAGMAWYWRDDLRKALDSVWPQLPQPGGGTPNSILNTAGESIAAAYQRVLNSQENRTFLDANPSAPINTSTSTRQQRMQRALRNKNPGNIKDAAGNPWLGKIGVDDAGFVQFESNELGLRALARVLRNYASNGYRTIHDIVYRYAPPADNNPTESYIRTVVSVSGIPANAMLDLTDAHTLERIMLGIIKHETGMPWSVAEIRRGIQLEASA